MPRKRKEHLAVDKIRVPKYFIEHLKNIKGSYKTYFDLILSRFPEITIKQYKEAEQTLDLFEQYLKDQKVNTN